MSKTKSKILLAIFLILFLVSSCCFATIEPRTVEAQPESETTQSETQGEATPTSEDGIMPISETEDGGATTSQQEDPSWTNGDLYVAEDKVTISNVVDGNAFVVGKEVTITGEIGGDLFVFADKVNIEGGYIYSSIFACANEITVNGVVYDVYAVCKTFNLEENGFIYRDLKLTAAEVNINGKIRRDAYIDTDKMNLNAEAGNLIYGKLNYSSATEIEIPEQAVVGEVKYTKASETTENSVVSTILSYVLDLVKTLLFTFVMTVVLLWLTPKFIERVEKMDVAKSFISLGIGFATPIVAIIVSLLLIFSTVGSSIFVFGLFAFIALAFLGFTITSIFFGKLLAKQFKMEGNIKFIMVTLATAAVLWILCQIPMIGWLISFVISIFGIGTTLVNMIGKKEKETVKE